MTRERKLAIQMWEEIKRQLPQWKYDIAVNVKTFKADFCWQNDLAWKWDCWFCQYFRGDCDKCPLHSCHHCDPAAAWCRLVDEYGTIESRIAACDEIIAALKGQPRPHIEEVKQ